MTYPRKALVSLQETPYYHCVARCVRRAWLWGVDEYADKDYSHRKPWVVDRLRVLSSIFSIDVCAYAVMSNHYHVVLHIDSDEATHWSEAEIMQRWGQVFKHPALIQRYRSGEAVSMAEQRTAKAIIAVWRTRLMDVSWFMRCLNEHLARKANEEDACTGRFWEGRFKSQALLDEAGVLTAMAYVDLNPVRAGIATTPEESEFTSVYERIRALKGNRTLRLRLRPFRDQAPAGRSLPCTHADYLQLLDWTSRTLRPKNGDHIDRAPPSILSHLNIDPIAWRTTMLPRGNAFGRAIGRLDRLRIHASALGLKWIRGLRRAERMYPRV